MRLLKKKMKMGPGGYDSDSSLMSGELDVTTKAATDLHKEHTLTELNQSKRQVAHWSINDRALASEDDRNHHNAYRTNSGAKLRNSKPRLLTAQHSKRRTTVAVSEARDSLTGRKTSRTPQRQLM